MIAEIGANFEFTNLFYGVSYVMISGEPPPGCVLYSDSRNDSAVRNAALEETLQEGEEPQMVITVGWKF